jgi:hypothetical protein
MKYNQSSLDRLEKLLDDSGYILRYERGTFQSGYCILEQRKVVVLNKFLQVEGKVTTLLEIIPQLAIDAESLSEDSRKTYDEVMLRYAEQ